MAICYGIKVMVCDECGKRWLPESENLPAQCPNRDCRSRKWNKSGKVYDAPDYIEHPDPAAPPPAAAASLGDVMARFGLTTASKMHEQPSAPILTPVEDDEPTLPMCAYTEYDPESGETYQCGLRQHSFKVKHTRGSRV